VASRQLPRKRVECSAAGTADDERCETERPSHQSEGETDETPRACAIASLSYASTMDMIIGY
jgi:hypothetical protein